mgnify:CR=1 FL=1
MPLSSNSKINFSCKLTNSLNYSDTLALSPQTHLANADTGSTGHFMSFQDTPALLDVKLTTSPVVVTLPDGTRATSTHTAMLNFPTIPYAAQRVDVFPNWIGSLLSIGMLCDCGLTAVYTSTTVTIRDNKQNVVLTGTRSPSTKLWMVDLRSAPSSSSTVSHPSMFSAAVVTEPTGTHQQIVDYYVATMGSPATTTLISAIDKLYVQLPGITSSMLRKYPPSSVATSMGHLDQCRQGMWSTKIIDHDESESDLHPVPIPKTSSHQLVMTKVVYIEHPSQERHTDLTGSFPITAKSCARCLMFMICGNYIHIEPMKSRGKEEFVRAQRKLRS